MRFVATIAALLAAATAVSARAAFSDGRDEDLWRRGCPAACAVNCPDVSSAAYANE